MTAPESFAWADPPPSPMAAYCKRGLFKGIPEMLRQRPGEWALVGRHSQSTTTQVKAGRRGFVPAGAYEATSRVVPGTAAPRVFDIYIRFVGESGEFV